MNIIIHDFPVNFPDEFYKKESAGTLKDYNRIGWEDRDKSYFRYAILAGVRAIDYLAGRKDVDAKQIAVTGSSQGGGLTLCVSGLDDRVALAAPNIAGLCDLNARSQGRIDGWPHWAAVAPPKLQDKIEATSQYFDAVNFARKFKGKSLHGVGFLDALCPPSTVYAAFNQHPEPKVMIDSPKMGHSTDVRWTLAREGFWKENLKLRPAPMPVEKKKAK
jgi:cephalosporin-C deacetylase-like acetyl esterase